MASAEVDVTRADGIVWIRLDAEASRNSLSLEMLEVMLDCVRSVEPGGDRALVVTGARPGSFCSGFRLGTSTPEAITSGAAQEMTTELFELLSHGPVPTVAIVDGPAYGGGCELALRCDVRLASTKAVFAIPALKLGMPYTPSSVDFLAGRYGTPCTELLFLAGSRISAERAAQLGMVHEVHPEAELAAAGDRVLAYLVDGAPLVARYLKLAIEAGGGQVDRPAVAGAYEQVRGSADLAEALAAVAEGRAPRFEGR